MYSQVFLVYLSDLANLSCFQLVISLTISLDISEAKSSNRDMVMDSSR